jgi:putative FmdB family regulatory protein
MPMFDFRCTACGGTFELLIRGGAVPICPGCAAASLEKLVALPAAPGKSAAIIGAARSQAAREGHFSNYAPSERPRS